MFLEISQNPQGNKCVKSAPVLTTELLYVYMLSKLATFIQAKLSFSHIRQVNLRKSLQKMVKQNPMINIGLKRSRYLSCQLLYHSLSLVVIRCTILCNSLPLVVLLVVTRCHSLSFLVTRFITCCHSLPFVVTRCITRCYSLSLVVPLVCLFINDQHRL